MRAYVSVNVPVHYLSIIHYARWRAASGYTLFHVCRRVASLNWMCE